MINYWDYRDIRKVARRPPMGWNSRNSHGTTVTEADVKTVADYMAAHLLPFGYEYIIIDMGWYAAGSDGEAAREAFPRQSIDAHGRLLPDPTRFPSAGNGGFKPLADYVHSRGLKFGLHVMRGIPIQAVQRNAPVLGSNVRARDIMKFEDRCAFYEGMYAVDMHCSGALEYYQSLFSLYNRWGVDFIKADDMVGRTQHFEEVKAFRYNLDQSRRPMILSLAPGPCDYRERSFVSQYADAFRISGDLEDDWTALRGMFALCRQWQGQTGPGHWGDCDLMPLGILRGGASGGGERQTRLTPEEQRTLVTLWSIFRSPLMLGMDVTRLDPFALSLITNRRVLQVNQESIANEESWFDATASIWTACAADRHERYLAFFNLGDAPRVLQIDLERFGIGGPCAVADLWSGEPQTIVSGRLEALVEPHACRLLALA